MIFFQVWWESVPLRSKVIGYEVFYSMTAVEDLDQVLYVSIAIITINITIVIDIIILLYCSGNGKLWA